MMDDLTAFQRDILYVIGGLNDESSPYSLAIKEKLDRHYSGEINHGRLYPNLNELVDKESLDRRTNFCVISQRGCREIDGCWEWKDQTRLSRPEFTTGVGQQSRTPTETEMGSQRTDLDARNP
ncbi:transcription regulator [Halococcus salifodinae DSM 8989]|uniref:Transcription regulator n=1 Tax=Halococcus salifodinae DSM 8989 TaxID=1227456 RepID=M0MSN0_9EURY|nr:transcription regulator [Halococcus salifodinae DSM 8989]